MGKARSIASIVFTATGGGTKMLAKIWWSLRKGRGEVKKSAKIFFNTLQDAGIPREEAKEITIAYAKPAWEILSIRNIIKKAIEMEGSESPPSLLI